ncbi:hypothetical protein E1B28_012554 [Marasmius oreades]|uniref:Uncharacterized protein n=1 Tax=Marasmius oreades TaxID=181124 RepID=A0A9P7RRX1_9AGAR|nr:uncharacterized protein E1B28_012554 [Marasmius oreades]KAG7088575.1 hypothetical protein E1B28_012554 [Marasmius oreades]
MHVDEMALSFSSRIHLAARSINKTLSLALTCNLPILSNLFFGVQVWIRGFTGFSTSPSPVPPGQSPATLLFSCFLSSLSTFSLSSIVSTHHITGRSQSPRSQLSSCMDSEITVVLAGPAMLGPKLPRTFVTSYPPSSDSLFRQHILAMSQKIHNPYEIDLDIVSSTVYYHHSEPLTPEQINSDSFRYPRQETRHILITPWAYVGFHHNLLPQQTPLQVIIVTKSRISIQRGGVAV